MPDTDPVQIVLHYHERTKHAPERFARSLGSMDWATQPNPFRRYHDPDRITPPLVVDLPFPDRDDTPRLTDLFNDPADPAFRERHQFLAPRPLNLRNLGSLLFYSLAISAWKSHKGTRWSLRVNPSSGNLHPIEAYLLLPAATTPELSPDSVTPTASVAHYAPDRHQLELRASVSDATLAAVCLDLPGQGPGDAGTHATGVPAAGPEGAAGATTLALSRSGRFGIVLTSIVWREAWKYGERAFRYVQHDLGHALASLRVAAAMLGWRLTVVPDAPESELETLLGIDREAETHRGESETADLLAIVETRPVEALGLPGPRSVPAWPATSVSLRRFRSEARFFGRPNRLSQGHHLWPIVDEVERVTRRPVAMPAEYGRGEVALRRVTPPTSAVSVAVGPTASEAAGLSLPLPGPSIVQHAMQRSLSAGRATRQRRSAVAMDGERRLDRESFFWMLSRLDAAHRMMPWDTLPWRSLVHCAYFVHRVDGLAPGLYLQVREPQDLPELQGAMVGGFAWSPVDTGTPAARLYLLEARDLRAAFTGVCCRQAIGGDGVFGVAFLGRFKGVLQQAGPWWYRRLFWETGMLGQLLYLFAEAAGLRATGIGCYFDDETHRLLGIRRRAWQSLYHFTVGGGRDDDRASTAPAYGRRGFREPTGSAG